MNSRTVQAAVVIVLGSILSAGCGTTQWSDTSRTATEQLLISDAMDRAVARMDFRAVAGKKVYLDDDPLKKATDSAYLVSMLRQHMLASGCCLMEKREQADYVVEVRAGAVGTDRRDVTFGIPATSALSAMPGGAVAPTIPEMPLANKTEQRAVVKIAMFAYNRRTGRPVWQSGTVPVESKAKNLWLLGAGPFERGTIYEGTGFNGQPLEIPLVDDEENPVEASDRLAVTGEAYFAEPEEATDLKKPAAEQVAKKEAKPAAKKDTSKAAPKEQSVAKKDASKAAPKEQSVAKKDASKAAPKEQSVAKKDASKKDAALGDTKSAQLAADKKPPKTPAPAKSEVVPATHSEEIPPEDPPEEK